MVRVQPLIVLLFIAPCLLGFELEAEAGRPNRHKIYVRNHCDRPIRVFFVQQNAGNSFYVMRIKEGDSVLIENISPGRWQASIIELLNGSPIAQGAVTVTLDPLQSNPELLITGEWKRLGPIGYEIEVIQ